MQDVELSENSTRFDSTTLIDTMEVNRQSY